MEMTLAAMLVSMASQGEGVGDPSAFLVGAGLDVDVAFRELFYLRLFAVDVALREALGEVDATAAALRREFGLGVGALLEDFVRDGEEDQATVDAQLASVLEILGDRHELFARAWRAAHPSGPYHQLGRAFAALCERADDAAVVGFGARYAREFTAAAVSCIRCATGASAASH